MPYHRILRASDGNFKHIINLGSVGKPKDGDPSGCYVSLLTLNKDTWISESDSFKMNLKDWNITLKHLLRVLKQSTTK